MGLRTKLKKAIKPMLAPFMALSLVANSTMARAEVSRKAEAGAEWEQSSVTQVSGIPLKYRDVPRHPEDTYASERNVAPIEPDYIDLSSRIMVDDKMYFDLSLGKLASLKAGFGVDVDLLSLLTLGQFARSKDKRERNYTNNPGTEERGEHAALTYYSVYPAYYAWWNTFVRPHIFSEFELNPSKNFGIGAGYKLTQERLIFETGWDRYNGLEARERHALMDLTYGVPYLTFKVYRGDREKGNHFYLNLGAIQVLDKKVREAGREMNFSFRDNAVFVCLGVGFPPENK